MIFKIDVLGFIFDQVKFLNRKLADYAIPAHTFQTHRVDLFASSNRAFREIKTTDFRIAVYFWLIKKIKIKIDE